MTRDHPAGLERGSDHSLVALRLSGRAELRLRQQRARRQRDGGATAATVTPAQLAARAIRALPMGKPQIGVVPESTGRRLVGLPVWMWTAVGETTWGPVSRTASVPGLAVTARAEVTQIVWSMGDGGSVTCTTSGTRYQPAYQGSASPDCGWKYERPRRRSPMLITLGVVLTVLGTLGTYAYTAATGPASFLAIPRLWPSGCRSGRTTCGWSTSTPRRDCSRSPLVTAASTSAGTRRSTSYPAS